MFKKQPAKKFKVNFSLDAVEEAKAPEHAN